MNIMDEFYQQLFLRQQDARDMPSNVRSVEKVLAGTQRHPVIEDHVIIYAGATILGGEIRIGHHAVIGGNVWLTGSVEPYTTVYHEPNTRFIDSK